MIAKQFLLMKQTKRDTELMIENPMAEMRRMITIREILENPDCPYKAAFDTNLKTIHYYITGS